MRLLILADIDDLYWCGDEGQADVLIACGDLCEDVILGAAEDFHCKEIFAVKGNHDNATPFSSPIQDLHLQVVEFAGLRFAGLNGSWKYKPHGPFLYEQQEVEQMLADFPPVDIFISHNSPRYIHDKEDGIHTGFGGLNSYIERTQPKLVIHGHQHINRESHLNLTPILGVYGNTLLEF